LPPLEKAALVYASYEIFFNPGILVPSLINKIIEFSKKYLETEKYKYINKVLDLLFKSSPEKTTKDK
jgi:transcription termination factor NusB